MKISKTTPGIEKQRKTIKTFKFSEDGHKFLNKQPDNNWAEYTGPLKPGVYAFVGGEWRSVKTLDFSVLAHV